MPLIIQHTQTHSHTVVAFNVLYVHDYTCKKWFLYLCASKTTIQSYDDNNSKQRRMMLDKFHVVQFGRGAQQVIYSKDTVKMTRHRNVTTSAVKKKIRKDEITETEGKNKAILVAFNRRIGGLFICFLSFCYVLT